MARIIPKLKACLLILKTKKFNYLAIIDDDNIDMDIRAELKKQLVEIGRQKNLITSGTVAVLMDN